MSLDWPPELGERTPSGHRTTAYKFQATLGDTTKSLAAELDRMGVDDWRASIGNQHTKSNTLPRHNADPDDPGFVLRWSKGGEQYAVGCDAYTRLRDNVREVYLWIHETRMRGQREVVTGDAEFAAARLPPGDTERAKVVGRPPPHEILGVAEDAPDGVVKAAYRELAKGAHADAGGSTAEMKRLNRAKEELLNST